MSKVIRRLRQLLSENGIQYTISTSPALEQFGVEHCSKTVGFDQSISMSFIRDVSYIDDIIVPVYAPAKDVLGIVRCALHLVDLAFSSFGFALNYKPGKSEVVFIYAGPGSVSLRKRVHSEHASRIVFSDAVGNDVDVTVSI
eukprot:12401443-Karenia_brevis.AAC.1